jgi:D-alanyl-D-alanine carboxypeptidase/D-alanyl-D-alanine-endopeptidase (penicillin-binding protein 4)
MRVVVSILAALIVLGTAPVALGTGGGGALGGAGSGSAGGTGGKAPSTPAVRSLSGSLGTGMREAGSYSGADVVDLSTGDTLYSHNATTGRLPASVEKLYTTSTALLRFGANGRLSTSVLGEGQQNGATFTGTLYLRGGGDPTFGSAGFDRANYGAGATMQSLVSNLLSATHIRTLKGSIVADESWFDSERGTPATGGQPSIEVEGELSGLAYNRGWANSDGTVYFEHPALEAGQQFAAALKAAGVRVIGPTRTGRTPAGARILASVHSPTVAKLISLTNTPSDNFFAEMLAKDIGARFGAGGTTGDGAAVIQAQVAKSFGIHPRLDDGSGLSRYDRTTPDQVVTLLRDMSGNQQFTGSLAVAGETGTLVDEMRGTYAAGRCRGKTGTLHDASNVVGYCQARDGHTLAFAFLMNGITPDYAHPIQDQMQVAIAKYDG